MSTEAQKRSYGMFNKKAVCDSTQTLLCLAVALIAVIIIVASLKQLGVFSFGKYAYNGVSYGVRRGAQTLGLRRPSVPAAQKAQTVPTQVPVQPMAQVKVPVKPAEQYDEDYDEEYDEEYDNDYEGYDNDYEEYDNDYEGYDNEYADTLEPEKKRQQDIDEMKKDIKELKEKCSLSAKSEAFDNSTYFDENPEAFGSLNFNETKEFDNMICNGTGQAENIANPVASNTMDFGVRCTNQGQTLDYIIGDMHPYHLNEIAAGGEGNEVIAATTRPRRSSKRRLVDNAKLAYMQ